MKKKNLTNRKILRSTSKKNMYLITVQSTKVNGRKTTVTVTECRSGPTAPSTRADGRITRPMAGASFGMLTGTCSTDSGKKTKPTGGVYMST